MRVDPAGSRAAPAVRGGGGAAVTVATDVEALVGELVERTSDAADHEIAAMLKVVQANAVRQWPVDTGRSKASFSLTDSGTPDNPAWRLRNDAPYSRAIVQHNQSPKLPSIRLVYTPVRDALRSIADKIRRGAAGGGR
jgi:hypothetical protein